MSTGCSCIVPVAPGLRHAFSVFHVFAKLWAPQTTFYCIGVKAESSKTALRDTTRGRGENRPYLFDSTDPFNTLKLLYLTNQPVQHYPYVMGSWPYVFHIPVWVYQCTCAVGIRIYQTRQYFSSGPLLTTHSGLHSMCCSTLLYFELTTMNWVLNYYSQTSSKVCLLLMLIFEIAAFKKVSKCSWFPGFHNHVRSGGKPSLGQVAVGK